MEARAVARVFLIDGPDPALPAVLFTAAAGLVAALVAFSETVRAVADPGLGADAGLRARIGERARRLARPRVALSLGRVDGRAGGVVGLFFVFLLVALPSASHFCSVKFSKVITRPRRRRSTGTHGRARTP